MKDIKTKLKIAIPIIVCIIISNFFITKGLLNYETINKPAFAPKPIIFVIVWTLIYSIFYATTYLAYNKSHDKEILILLYMTLFFHCLWNLFFFFLDYKLIGLITLIVIYIVSWAFVFTLGRVDKKYAYYNFLYLIWLLVAVYLNLTIWNLNQQTIQLVTKILINVI